MAGTMGMIPSDSKVRRPLSRRQVLHSKSPLWAISTYETVDPSLYHAEGLIALLGISYLPLWVVVVVHRVSDQTEQRPSERII